MSESSKPEDPEFTESATAPSTNVPDRNLSESGRRRSYGTTPSQISDRVLSQEMTNEAIVSELDSADNINSSADSNDPTQVAVPDDDSDLNSATGKPDGLDDRFSHSEAYNAEDLIANTSIIDSIAVKSNAVSDESLPQKKSGEQEKEHVELEKEDEDQGNSTTSSNEIKRSGTTASTDDSERIGREKQRWSANLPLPTIWRNISRSVSRRKLRFFGNDPQESNERPNSGSNSDTVQSELPTWSDANENATQEDDATTKPYIESSAPANRSGRSTPVNSGTIWQRFITGPITRLWASLVVRFDWAYLCFGLLLAFLLMPSQQDAKSFFYPDPFMPVHMAGRLLSAESVDQLAFTQSTLDQKRFYLVRQFRSLQALSIDTLARFGAVSDYCEVLQYAPDVLTVYVDQSSPLWEPATEPAIRRDVKFLEPLARRLYDVLTTGPKSNISTSGDSSYAEREQIKHYTPSMMINEVNDLFRVFSIVQARGFKNLATSLAPSFVRRLFFSKLARARVVSQGGVAALSRYYSITSVELSHIAKVLEYVGKMSIQPAAEAAAKVLESRDLARLVRSSSHKPGWGIPANTAWAVRRTYLSLLAELGFAAHAGNAGVTTADHPDEPKPRTRLSDPWFRDLGRVAADVVRCSDALYELRQNVLELSRATNASAKMILPNIGVVFEVGAELDTETPGVPGAAARVTAVRSRTGEPLGWDAGAAPALWPLMIIEPHVSYRAAGMAMG